MILYRKSDKKKQEDNGGTDASPADTSKEASASTAETSKEASDGTVMANTSVTKSSDQSSGIIDKMQVRKL